MDGHGPDGTATSTIVVLDKAKNLRTRTKSEEALVSQRIWMVFILITLIHGPELPLAV